MDMLLYIYMLGVIYIVFSILWFFISSLPKFLSGAFKTNSFSNYTFKIVQYFLIAALTAVQTSKFIENNPTLNGQAPFFITLGGIVIFLYLAGKTDKAIMSVQIQSTKGRIQLGGALKYEPHIVGVSIILYLLSFNFPILINNPITTTLHSGILNFYDTFFIHFIISIIAFFFLFSLFSRGFSAVGRLVEFINHIITGKPLSKRKTSQKNPFQNMGNMGGFNNGKNPFNMNSNIFNQNEETKVDEEVDEGEYVDFEEIEEDKDDKND